MGVTGCNMPEGVRRSKALRGCENLKAQRTECGKLGISGLRMSECAVGDQTPGEYSVVVVTTEARPVKLCRGM